MREFRKKPNVNVYGYDRDKPIVHVRIARTGSTSLQQNLLEMLPAGKLYATHFSSAPESAEFHKFVRFENLPENHDQFVTFVREPFEWIYSYYNMRSVHESLLLFGLSGLETYIRNPKYRFEWYLPEGSMSTALENFLFVGEVSQYDRCLKKLADILEIECPEPRMVNSGKNITDEFNSSIEGSMDEYDRLRDLHKQCDPRLYEFYDRVVGYWESKW